MLAGIGVVGRGREGEIKSKFKGLFSHVGNNPIEKRTGALKARIGIYFNEPGLELAIYHEVQTKNLEVIHEVSRCNFSIHTTDRIRPHPLHLRQDLLFEVIFFV